jgi:hypothetical protein
MIGAARIVPFDACPNLVRELTGLVYDSRNVEHGAVPILRKKHGITADALVEKVLPLLRKKSSVRPSVA